VDSALCYGFQIKPFDALGFLLVRCPSLIFPFSRITTTFGVDPWKFDLISLNRTVIGCYTIHHHFSSCEFFLFPLSMFIAVICACTFASCTSLQFPNSIKHNPIKDLCCIYLNGCLAPDKAFLCRTVYIVCIS